jgi:uncharacterized protein
MAKGNAKKSLFSLAKVLFKDSPIEGRGVFARRPFAAGDEVTAYAPKQTRVEHDDPRAVAAAATKLTLSSDDFWVIIPDTSEPGGWLCNHSCKPNAALYSSGEGRIRATRAIAPGEEVTIFYGWVTENEPERDVCRCAQRGCRGTINFDLSAADALALEGEGPATEAVRQRLEAYATYLRSIDQEQVLDVIQETLHRLRRSCRLAQQD